MNDATHEKLIVDLTKKLLESISKKDWESYCELTDEELSCIEPETGNDVCVGLKFHEFYFKLNKRENIKIQENILNPHVKFFGDFSVISYRRVTQICNDEDKTVNSVITGETRVWKKSEDKWKMIHFHRS